MANSDHIKWLLNGIESWNSRREQEDFVPDFSGADIYNIFHNAGKLNSDGHIPLSGSNLTKADFSKSCLCNPSLAKGADLSHASLYFANLQFAQMANSKLDDASLFVARFDNANLSEASLRNAKMASTAFPEATLTGADLRGVNFSNAYLKNADLSFAEFDRSTDLSDATITGVKFEWVQPWEAKLYKDSLTTTGPHTQTNNNRHIERVADLIKKCTDLGVYQDDCLLYFRGECSNTWELRPSVMRCSQDDRSSFRSSESDMLLDLMSRRPEDFNDTASTLTQCVLAQHHGLKTRLLDITRNPLVAMFAACESSCNNGLLHVFSMPKKLVKPFNSDTISIIANFSKLSRPEQKSLLGWSMDNVIQGEPDLTYGCLYEQAMGKLYHLIRREKPHFEKNIDPRDFFRVFIVEPQQSFERIRVQSGAFLVSAFHERFERSEVLKWNSGIPIYNHYILEVPNENKQDILAELRLLNMTRETLFPGLDEAAKAITHAHSR